MATMQSRRRFVTNAAVAGAAGLGAFVAALGAREPSWAAEPPPEITTLRLGEWPVTCGPQQWVAPALLHAEGFGDVQYYTWGAQKQDWAPQVLVSGDVDISVSFIPADLMFADSGEPVVWLAGSHIGCVELVANERVHSARDLKGKTVGIGAAGDLGYIFTAMFASYVGLDPRKDINWFVDPRVNVEQLAEGKFDAIMIGPPDSVAAREKKIGHALVRYYDGQTMVAVFMLYVLEHSGVRPPLPGRNQARPACASQSIRPLCFRAGADRSDHGYTRRAAKLHQLALRVHSARPERDPLWAMAGLRSRGCAALARTVDARPRNDQEHPAEAHRGAR